MRASRKFGRILLLLSLVLGLNALYSNAQAPHWHFAHVPQGGHGHFPSQRSHRHSSRSGRRSQNWEAPDSGVAAELQAHEASVAATSAPAVPPVRTAAFDHVDVWLPLAAFPFEPVAVTEPLADAPVLAVGSAPRAPGSARGPPVS